MKRKVGIIAIIFVVLFAAAGIYTAQEGGLGVVQYKILDKTVDRNFKTIESHKITFLGDSKVARCNYKALFNKDIVNEGISGNYTWDILDRLNSVIKLHPKKLFLNFGVNDLRQVDGQKNTVNIEKSLNNYRKIVNEIEAKSPKTKIYIESITPVDNKLLAKMYETNKIYNFHISNSDINKFNDGLRQLSISKHFPFIEHKAFNASTETIDGLHPTIQGYVTMKPDLEKYVQ